MKTNAHIFLLVLLASCNVSSGLTLPVYSASNDKENTEAINPESSEKKFIKGLIDSYPHNEDCNFKNEEEKEEYEKGLREIEMFLAEEVNCLMNQSGTTPTLTENDIYLHLQDIFDKYPSLRSVRPVRLLRGHVSHFNEPWFVGTVLDQWIFLAKSVKQIEALALPSKIKLLSKTFLETEASTNAVLKSSFIAMQRFASVASSLQAPPTEAFQKAALEATLNWEYVRYMVIVKVMQKLNVQSILSNDEINVCIQKFKDNATEANRMVYPTFRV